MGLWLHDQIFQCGDSHSHAHACQDWCVGCFSGSSWGSAGESWSISRWMEGMCVRSVLVCAIELLLISYGRPLHRSIAVSLHNVVLTAHAIWNHPHTSRPQSIYTKQVTLTKACFFLLHVRLKFPLFSNLLLISFHYYKAHEGLIRSEVYPNKLKWGDKPGTPLLSSDLMTPWSFIRPWLNKDPTVGSFLSFLSVFLLYFLARQEERRVEWVAV